MTPVSAQKKCWTIPAKMTTELFFGILKTVKGYGIPKVGGATWSSYTFITSAWMCIVVPLFLGICAIYR